MESARLFNRTFSSEIVELSGSFGDSVNGGNIFLIFQIAN